MQAANGLLIRITSMFIPLGLNKVHMKHSDGISDCLLYLHTHLKLIRWLAIE